ncbi:MAG: hypothetical protein KAT71_04685 [Gammaproteobacteria bacterium]|nr:hypothetical protein [Gammaproteobacteria bacterium]
MPAITETITTIRPETSINSDIAGALDIFTKPQKTYEIAVLDWGQDLVRNRVKIAGVQFAVKIGEETYKHRDDAKEGEMVFDDIPHTERYQKLGEAFYQQLEDKFGKDLADSLFLRHDQGFFNMYRQAIQIGNLEEQAKRMKQFFETGKDAVPGEYKEATTCNATINITQGDECILLEYSQGSFEKVEKIEQKFDPATVKQGEDASKILDKTLKQWDACSYKLEFSPNGGSWTEFSGPSDFMKLVFDQGFQGKPQAQSKSQAGRSPVVSVQVDPNKISVVKKQPSRFARILKRAAGFVLAVLGVTMVIGGVVAAALTLGLAAPASVAAIAGGSALFVAGISAATAMAGVAVCAAGASLITAEPEPVGDIEAPMPQQPASGVAEELASRRACVGSTGATLEKLGAKPNPDAQPKPEPPVLTDEDVAAIAAVTTDPAEAPERHPFTP